jgi:hypothetical protein
LNAGISYRLDFHEDYITAEDVLEKKLKKQQRQDNKTFKKNKKDLKKQEKQLKKTLNKNTKKEKKRNRKAKKS